MLSTQAAEARALRDVVALEVAAVLRCHAAPVVGLAAVGGLLFSGDVDAALAAWPRPRPRDGGGVDVRPPRVTAPYAARLTALAPLADRLASADATGNLIVHKAARYRETLKLADAARPTAAPVPAAVLEKPRFFYGKSLKDLSPATFLARILWHYYPPCSLRRARVPDEEEDDDEYDDDELAATSSGSSSASSSTFLSASSSSSCFSSSSPASSGPESESSSSSESESDSHP